MLLTQSTTPVIGFVSQLLGYLMEGIFYVLNVIGIPNIGLSIILFTIIIYLCLTPLTIQQQKFSKLQVKMSPELQAIQAKYKGKKDNDSMMMMNQETQAVYAKNGVSPSGSCAQMAIQLPILWALYKVIYSMPAYVTQIKSAFFPLVDDMIKQTGSADLIKKFTNAAQFSKQFTNENYTKGVTSYIQNTYIDILNRASTSDWLSIKSKYPTLSVDVDRTLAKIDQYNNFLGLNIGNSPLYTLKAAISSGKYILVLAAVMIPLLSALTQWFNTKLIPVQAKSGNEQADQMAQQMKTMNIMMPIISAWFTFTLPAGMGIYWIAGAVVRSVQQILINKHIDKMDFNAIIEKNKEKAAKKMEKKGLTNSKLKEYASVTQKAEITDNQKYSAMVSSDKEKVVKDAEEYYSANAKEGGIASKANMVKQYNEKNNKK